jgi:hypothetical protein
MTPEQKKALQTIQETDFGFGENSADQVDLQELQELAEEALVTGDLGSDVTDLCEKVKESLNDLAQSIPTFIDEYLVELDPIAKRAARVAELIAPGAEGNPTDPNSAGYEEKLEEVGSTLAALYNDSQNILGGQLAQISYFKNIVQRENNKLATEIEFIYRSHNKDITQKEVKDLKDRLEVIARLPEIQPGKLESQQESCSEEISRLVRACNTITRSE